MGIQKLTDVLTHKVMQRSSWQQTFMLRTICLQITMWDLASGKLLRSITDAHPPGTAILHIKVTNVACTLTPPFLKQTTTLMFSQMCWLSLCSASRFTDENSCLGGMWLYYPEVRKVSRNYS